MVILKGMSQSQGGKLKLTWKLEIIQKNYTPTFLVLFTLSVIKMIFPASPVRRLNHEMSLRDNALGSIRNVGGAGGFVQKIFRLDEIKHRIQMRKKVWFLSAEQ